MRISDWSSTCALPIYRPQSAHRRSGRGAGEERPLFQARQGNARATERLSFTGPSLLPRRKPGEAMTNAEVTLASILEPIAAAEDPEDHAQAQRPEQRHRGHADGDADVASSEELRRGKAWVSRCITRCAPYL